MDTSETPTLHVSDVKRSMQENFSVVDYAVFVAMLGVCVGIGVYFGFVKKQKSTQDYLMGGRNMSVVPVAFSLVASYISGISLVGIPTEVYVYGVQYLFQVVSFVLSGPAMAAVFLPMFHELQLVSTYGYLEKRFDRRVRVLGSLLFMISTMGWLPIVIYVPALAFNLITGVNIHIVTPVVCCVCIFYTCVGGLKAVVWTDVVQTVVMVFPMMLVVVRGALASGGFAKVWNDNWESGRIETLSWSLDHAERYTVWSMFVGGTLYALSGNACSQSMMQRYLSLPSVDAAKRALWSYLLGVALITTLCGTTGLVLFSYYRHCDPLDSQLAGRKDQMLPLLVMDVLGDMPGLPGLFVAGVFSAALSSLSTGLNSMSAVILEDFYKPFFKEPGPRSTQLLMRSSVAVLGVICVGLVFVVEKLGTVLQVTMSLSSATAGPQLSLFIIGMFMPWINANCALGGAATGLLGGWWVVGWAQVAQARGQIVFPEKPRHLHNCTYHYEPSSHNLEVVEGEVPALYRLSFMWYCSVGFCLSMVAACFLSAIFHTTVKEDPRLYAPVLRRFLAKRRSRSPADSQDGSTEIKAEEVKIRNRSNSLCMTINDNLPNNYIS